MRDIEWELRELGATARTIDSTGGALTAPSRRRIKLRRVLFAGTGAVTALALAATASVALGLVGSDRGIAPAEDPSSMLIRFERSGGFTSDHHIITIGSDGSGLLESPGSRGLVEPIRFELGSGELASIEDAIDQVEWESLESPYRGAVPLVADGYFFEIQHRGYVVETESGIEPRSLRPLIDLLSGIIEERLNDAVAGEPTLTLSKTDVRPGDVVELAISARSDHTWGVLTSLESEEDGGWRRIGYWRTWPGKGPKVLQAITTLDGAVEDIGFSGSADFKLLIPALEPGSYRISKEFVAPAGTASVGRTVEAEVRFEIVADSPAPSEDADFRAIWPEDTYQDAREACEAAMAEDADEEEGDENVVSIRSDPESVILEFGYEVLGWIEGETFHPGVDIPSERTVYGLRRGDTGETSPREPEVLVDATEVQPGCWSVRGVSRMPDKRPTGVSVSVRGRDVKVGVDPLGATSLAIRVVYAGRDVSETGPVGEEGLGEFRLPFDPDTPGYALILFLDPEGAVFSAASASFPAGDVTAG